MNKLLLTAIITLPGLAHAETAAMTTITTQYTCDNGTEVPATYVNTGEETLVILTIEGKQVALMTQIAASGSKYAPSEGEAGFVWWEHQGEVAFSLQGKTEAEDQDIATCKAKE